MSGLVILALLLCAQQTLQVTKQEFYPFGINDETLPNEVEDTSSNEIPLKGSISYFGNVYKSIFVNTNGMLSFMTEIPSFYNIQFPLDYPVIAVLYSDVDTRGRGKIYFSESQTQDVLDRLSDEIRLHFSFAEDFQATSAFIATWDDVGYYDKKTDKGNSFQIVLVTDDKETFAVNLYENNGINWIQSDGKTPGLPDAKAQAGFMSGDGRMFTLHGSGTDHVRSLDKLSNVGKPGQWMFHLGKLVPGENIGLPDQNLGTSDFNDFNTCAQGAALCHIDSRCVDYSTGYCCECGDKVYGNGLSCMANGQPQRLNGKVVGILNGIELGETDLHSYVVTADGRQYTAVSKIPMTVGYDMQSLITIGGVIGWLFALPRGKAKNGFQLTGGVFNRTVDIEYPQTGHSVKINQQFTGVDAFNYLRVHTEIKGTAPVIPSGAQLQMNDYNEEYTRVLPGLIRSQSSLSFTVGESGGVETQFKVEQIIMYDECTHSPKEPELETLRMNVARPFYIYDSREEIVRYASTNKISTLGGADPCKEGRERCPANSSCIVDGDSYKCVCHPGYEYFYEDAGGGVTRSTCVDINECATGRDNCHIQAKCINQLGSFQCVCESGYVGDGVRCEKIQTCEDLNCHENAECTTVGPTRALECRCQDGYQGDGYHCTIIGSEQTCNVEDNTCDPNAECIYSDLTKRYTCRCLKGYRGDGLICLEEDSLGYESCNIINNCHPHAQCQYDSSESVYVCRCNAGYEGDGYNCQSADVSCDQVKICSTSARCVYDRIQEKHICVCEEGYDGDGINCNPADECDSADSCGSNAQCAFDNILFRYNCVCDQGYEMQPDRVCTKKTTDTNEEVSCDVVNNCHANAKCILDSTSRRHFCQCDPGYVGDGLNCKTSVTPCNVYNNCDVNAECAYEPETSTHRCQCREGYVGDGYNCIQGKACNNNPLICDSNAECVQLADLAVSVCQCRPGYIGDGTTCAEAPKFEGNFLIASQGMSIVRMPLQASRGDLGKPVVMQPSQTAIGLDVDCSAGHIYWSDVSGKVIKRSNYDGSDLEVFIQKDVDSPEGIAVDWIGRNLFWCDSLKDTIEVARIDSPNRDRKVLIDSNLTDPRGLVVHPLRGLIFWSDWNRLEPKIESANMDGSGRTLLINTDLELPNSLTIDLEREEICWADAGTKRIECCNLIGQNRRTIISATSYPFGLTNNRQNIYWTDWETGKIEIVAKFGGQLQAPLEPPLGGSGKLYGVVAVPERCSRGSSPCSVQNGGCRYICLPNGYGSRTCACPDYTEDEEEPNCNEI